MVRQNMRTITIPTIERNYWTEFNKVLGSKKDKMRIQRCHCRQQLQQADSILRALGAKGEIWNYEKNQTFEE